MGFNWLRIAGSLQGDSLLFTTKSPEILGAIWSTTEGWKAEPTVQPSSGFEHGTPTPGLGIYCLNHLVSNTINFGCKKNIEDTRFYNQLRYFMSTLTMKNLGNLLAPAQTRIYLSWQRTLVSNFIRKSQL